MSPIEFPRFFDGARNRAVAIVAGALLSSSVGAMDFSLYGDVAFTNRSHDLNQPSFMLGAVDLFSAQRVSEKSTAFLELLFDANADGYKLDVERLWVERSVSSNVNIGAGRIHSPLGFWNSNYHHGVFAQDTVSRPFFLEFESQERGILPNHVVGLFSNSSWTVNDNVLLVQAAVGNGPSINTSNTGVVALGHPPPFGTSNITDFNGSKAFVGRVSYIDQANHFHVGVFGMVNDLAEASSGDPATNLSGLPRGQKLYNQMIGGADARYSVDSFYLMGEFVYLRSTDLINNLTLAPVPSTYGSYAYYVQGGWRYEPGITLIGRYEGNTFLNADSYYALRKIRGEAHYVFGVRYDLDDSSALRFEVNQTKPRVGQVETVTTLQWIFLLL